MDVTNEAAAIESGQFSSSLSTPPKTMTSSYPMRGSNSIQVVQNTLSAKECNDIINCIEMSGVSPPSGFDRSVRDCKRRHTIDADMSTSLMARLRPYLPEVLVADGGKIPD